MPKKNLLYLATFDPTVSATGTTTRGKLFLRFFSEHYHVHLVHLEEKQEVGRDEALLERLASLKKVKFTPFNYFLYSPALSKAGCEVLEKNPVDFIFADFEKSGWYAYRLSRKYRIPYIYNSHNVEYLRYIDFARRNQLRYPLVPYMYLLERIATRNALLTIAISDKDAHTFQRWAPKERVLAFPSAFDEEQFNPFYEDAGDTKPVVLMVGNYRNPGNREGAYLLYQRILPDVIARHPEVIFRCVGKDFPEDIRHPNIEVLGFVDDLMAEYRKAHLVIVPITMGGGIKIKVIEGLATGKYVISTPKGVEGIQTQGLVNLQVSSLEGFSACINDALENPQPHTVENWERVRKEYGVHCQLNALREQIEQVLVNYQQKRDG